MSNNNQPDVGPYRQRFSQIATMMRLLHVEDAAGLDIAEDGYFESRLLVAQPPGMPSLPAAILQCAADYDRSSLPAVVGA